jgi:hypothetical protein
MPAVDAEEMLEYSIEAVGECISTVFFETPLSESLTSISATSRLIRI